MKPERYLKTPKDWLNDRPALVLKHLYKTNYPWLEKYVLQNSGSTEDAQDIFQESLIAAWINLKEGRFTGSEEEFIGYLRKICKYKWLTQLRSATHKKIHYAEDISIFESASDNQDTIEEQLSQTRLLQSSFAQLGEKCREILGLFYYQRKSLAEIGLVQNNTEDSIKTIKYRCMMQLRKIYLEKHKGNGEV